MKFTIIQHGLFGELAVKLYVSAIKNRDRLKDEVELQKRQQGSKQLPKGLSVLKLC